MNSTRPVSRPVFFQACGTSRGKNAQVPGPPTVTSSPIMKVISPSSTQATSSLSRCRCKRLLVPAGTVSSNIMMLSLVWRPTSFTSAKRPGAPMSKRVPPPAGTTNPSLVITSSPPSMSGASVMKRPHPAIPRETDRFHLAGDLRAAPFGDAPRAGVLRKNGRDRVRPPQNVARVVANATRRFGREPPAPDGGVERVAELTLEGQRDVSRRLFAPEPSSANPRLGCRGFDHHVHQAAAPDQRSVVLAHDREIAERELPIARESVPQPCGRVFGRARPASGIQKLRDFRECVDASEERQIVRRDPPQHEASRLELGRCRAAGSFCRRLHFARARKSG